MSIDAAPPSPRAPPRRRAIFAALGLVSVTAIGCVLWLANRDETLEFVPLRASTRGDSAAPLRTSPIVSAAFGDRLAPYVVALGRVESGPSNLEGPVKKGQGWERLRVARLELLSALLKEELGPSCAAVFGQMLDAAEEIALRGHTREGLAERFSLARGRVNEELATRGLAYFIDSYVAGAPRGMRVLLHAFDLEHVSTLRAGPLRVRAPNLRRLDRLNWSRGLLGFAGPEQADALVLLDQLEESLMTDLIAGVGVADGFPIFDARGAAQVDVSVRGPLQAQAARVVRAELVAAAGEGGERLMTLLSRRQALFATARANGRGRGIEVASPTRLWMGGEAIDAARVLLSSREDRELRKVERALRTAPVVKAYARLRDFAADGVEWHEVQHRLDFVRPGGLRVPAALSEFAGPARHGDGRENAFARSAAMELSAYLSELAHDERFTHTQLVRLAGFVLRPRKQGTDYSDATLTLLRALGEELSLAAGGPLVEQLDIVRSRVATLLTALLSVPRARLRAAARAAWAKLFGGPLATIERVAP